jgi:hypothetical protein
MLPSKDLPLPSLQVVGWINKPPPATKGSLHITFTLSGILAWTSSAIRGCIKFPCLKHPSAEYVGRALISLEHYCFDCCSKHKIENEDSEYRSASTLKSNQCFFGAFGGTNQIWQQVLKHLTKITKLSTLFTWLQLPSAYFIHHQLFANL